MISGKQLQKPSSQVNPNTPDGRLSSALLAPIRPQRMPYQYEFSGSNYSAELVPFPEYRNMLALSSRAVLPGPFLTSFTTGTTLPPPADPSSTTGKKWGAGLFAKVPASSPSPLQTTYRGEHVVLLL